MTNRIEWRRNENIRRSDVDIFRLMLVQCAKYLQHTTTACREKVNTTNNPSSRGRYFSLLLSSGTQKTPTCPPFIVRLSHCYRLEHIDGNIHSPTYEDGTRYRQIKRALQARVLHGHCSVIFGREWIVHFGLKLCNSDSDSDSDGDGNFARAASDTDVSILGLR